jgi:hypothetical protein
MYIDTTYNRRIRIEGAPDELHGYKLTIHDIDTGEMITNVIGVAVYIDVGEMNVAELYFHPYNEQGVIVVDADRNPVVQKRRLDNPEIAVSAMEALSEREDKHESR